MYCSKCGGKIDPNARYCDSCGEVVVKQPTQPSTPGSTSPSVQSPTNSGSSGGSSSSSSNIWLPVGLAALGAVLGWYLSGLLGFALGIGGASMATQQKKQGVDNQLPLVLTYILAVICVIFWIIAMGA